jgi:hypothetical protein
VNKQQILKEWDEWVLGMKAKHFNPKQVVPNIYNLMEKIKKGEIIV